MRRKGSSQGYIYFNKQRKTWQANFIYYDPESGARKVKTKTFKNEEDAKRYLATINYQKGNLLFIKNNGIPLIEFMRANLQLKLNINQISENQFLRVTHTIDRLQKYAFTKKNIDEITSDEIQEYLNSLVHLSNSMIEKAHLQLNQAFRLAHEKGYIMQNPMASVFRPRSKKENKIVRALELEEQQALVNYLNSKTAYEVKYKNAILYELFLGLRVGEALALTTHDIDLQNKLLNVHRTITVDVYGKSIMGATTKTYAGNRILPIPNFLIPAFIEQMRLANVKENNDEKLLFTGETSKYAHRECVNQQFKKLMKNLCNVTDVSTHNLRHTFGTRCIEAGMQPVVVQRLMGHKDIRVTLNTYTSVLTQFKETEIDKLNEYYLNQNLIPDNNDNKILLQD